MRGFWICAVLVGLIAALGGCATAECSTFTAEDPCDGGLCRGQTYCAVDAGPSACVPKKGTGESCTRNAECLSGGCDAGTCEVVPNGPCL
jgi:hypothetical protein